METNFDVIVIGKKGAEFSVAVKIAGAGLSSMVINTGKRQRI